MEKATTIILISFAAFVFPLIAGRLKVSAVTLEILFGIIVGPHILNLVEQSELLDFLAEFGLFLLMFLSGFEIDFGNIEKHGTKHLAYGAAAFGITLGLSFCAANILGYGPFIAFLLATTALGVVLPCLRNTRRTVTRLGQFILITALIADFLALVGVTIFALIQQHGVGWRMMNIPALFLLTAVLLIILKRIVWWRPEWFERFFSANDPSELGIRASLALMFIIVGLSYALDIEPILGAFLAGTVFALVFRHRGSLEQQLSGFSYGFLIPIFFINVGLSFELSELMKPGILMNAVELIGAAFAVKLLPPFIVLRRLPFREVLASGVLLTANLSLAVAVATLGVRIGLMDPGLRSSIIVLAIVTSTFAPTLFRILAPPLPAPSRAVGKP
ncbi:MAG: cation:proton antiporter [Acidobacteria bacterium]|nr:cation:proton antiporter [Acidobacteriota bacterium]